MKSVEWKTYRTRFLIKAKQLNSTLSFTDHLGREHRGRKGDYLVESCDGVLSIAPRQIFEDIYVAIGAREMTEISNPNGSAAMADGLPGGLFSGDHFSGNHVSGNLVSGDRVSGDLGAEAIGADSIKVKRAEVEQIKPSQIEARQISPGQISPGQIGPAGSVRIPAGGVRMEERRKSDRRAPRAARKSPQSVRSAASRLSLM